MTVWIERSARLGYASKGLVYMIAGALTGAAGVGVGGDGADRGEAFSFILRQPFGRAVLMVIVVGLCGYAVWRVISAITDSERRGRDAKGLAIRAGGLVRGLFYGAVALEVVSLVLRQRSDDSGSDEQARHWTARAMDQPFGKWAVVAAGLGIVAYGIYQLYRAWKPDVSAKLDLEHVHGAIVAVSRFGIGARALIFGIIGGSVVMAALRHDPGTARGTSGALREIAQQPFGGALLTAMGIGLVAYGLFAFVNARYREINA